MPRSASSARARPAASWPSSWPVAGSRSWCSTPARATISPAVRVRAPLPQARESVADDAERAGSSEHGRRDLPAGGKAGPGHRRQHAALGRLHAAPPRQRLPFPVAVRHRRRLADHLRRSGSGLRNRRANARRGGHRGRRVCVAASSPYPLPPFPYSYSDGLFAPACATVGVALQHLPQARNSVAYGGRTPVQRLRDLSGLPHRSEGQYRPHAHSPGRGDRATPSPAGGDGAEARDRSVGAGERGGVRGTRPGGAAAHRASVRPGGRRRRERSTAAPVGARAPSPAASPMAADWWESTSCPTRRST